MEKDSIDRVACVNCGLVKRGNFLLSLDVLRKLRNESDCCNLPNYIFYKGLGYSYKDEFKQKLIKKNPKERIQ
ncbi:MAG: hypothetical protein ACE5KG_04930 [Nitrososphaerales archaeon]